MKDYKVKHSNWAAPVVPVLKHNNTIRLCGDYRMTVNQASMVDTYPLPRVGELFTAMAGGKVFSKTRYVPGILTTPVR